MFGFDATWWTAFGAIAQALGAVATFAAVVVSLWLAVGERSLRADGFAAIWVSFPGDGTPGEYQVMFQLRNTGLRPIVWESVAWRVGWLRRGPKSLKYRWALQADGNANHFVTQTVQPSLTGMVTIPVAVMKPRILEEANEEKPFFRRRIKFLGNAPILAFAHVAGRKPVPLKVNQSLQDFLRTGGHETHLMPG